MTNEANLSAEVRELHHSETFYHIRVDSDQHGNLPTGEELKKIERLFRKALGKNAKLVTTPSNVFIHPVN